VHVEEAAADAHQEDLDLGVGHAVCQSSGAGACNATGPESVSQQGPM